MVSGNLLRNELRLGRRGLIIWTGVVVAFVGLYLGFFPVMQDPEMARAFESYPEAVKNAFNISLATMQDVNRYHGSLVMGYVLLLASIYGLMTAGGLISREADLRTAEFLYTRPVTRTQVMAAKVAAFVGLVLGLWAVTFAASTLVGLAVAGGDYDVPRQLIVHLVGLLATLAAGGLAFAAAPFIDQTQATTSLGAGVGLVFFLVDALANMTERLAFLRHFTIHHYAGLDQVAAGEPFLGGMLVLLGVFVSGVALGTFFLNRKDFVA